MTLDQITELFKWMTIINAGILILTTFLVMGLKNVMAKINSKLFSIKEEQIPVIAYGYLGIYKIMFIMFNLVPYISLTLIK